MAEILFATFAAFCLHCLFKPAGYPFRLPSGMKSPKTWLAVIGVVLIACPGVITLAGLMDSPSSASFLVREKDVLIPAGDCPPLQEAEYFLVRGWAVVEGNEEHPVEFFQKIMPFQKEEEIQLEDGSTLSLRLHSQDQGRVHSGASLEITFAYFGTTESHSGPFPVQVQRSIEEGYPSYQKTVNVLHPKAKTFGSLLAEPYRPLCFHILCTPLSGREAVQNTPAADWWNTHEEPLIALLQSDSHSGEEQWDVSSYNNYFGHPVKSLSVTGLLFLVVGSIFLLFATTNIIRNLCILLLFFTLYIGAMDSFVLRVYGERMARGTPAKRAAAITNVAGTRWHPITAANYLLDAAQGFAAAETRACAVRCLNRVHLLKALQKIEGSRDLLRTLAEEKEDRIAQAAQYILKRF